jgi:hypothetical protein
MLQPGVFSRSTAPNAPLNVAAALMSQVTVTWNDPVVGAGQAALQTLTVYAALDTNGNAGPLVSVGTVNPGVQTFTIPVGQLTPGNSYYFTVKATDVNGLQGPQGNWAGPLGPIGVPGPPTNVQATGG